LYFFWYVILGGSQTQATGMEIWRVTYLTTLTPCMIVFIHFQISKLDALIKKHEELIPTVLKTQVKVDLYWKCYAYGDELKPHIEFLDGIMLSSTRDIAPSCIENVEELIERQEKSLSQLETKRGVVRELIIKGKQLLENPE